MRWQLPPCERKPRAQGSPSAAAGGAIHSRKAIEARAASEPRAILTSSWSAVLNTHLEYGESDLEP